MVAYCGKSQIVDAGGEVLAIGSEREPGVLRAVVEIGAPPHRHRESARPAQRIAAAQAPVRVAISYEALPDGLDERLEILDDVYAIVPSSPERFAALDRAVPAVEVGDADVLDPAGLVGFKLAGYQLVVWTTGGDPAWAERFARARALELRVYVIVRSHAERRAYAVDPDGVVQCGTFGDFTLASFALDPQKTAQTCVAPGTDVLDGLQRVDALRRREEAIR